MRLKILAVPFSIIISLLIVIGYIKPDITAFQDKQVLLETKTQQSQGVITLVDRIDTLKTSLDGKKEYEDLINVYVPRSIDQDRTIDMLNYLAAQSGVMVSMMSMGDAEEKKSSQEEAVADPVLTEAGAVPVVSFKPKVQTYVGQVDVIGSYDGIKNFLNQVSHMNRFHQLLSFTIKKEETDEVENPEEFASILSGSLQVEFDYFPSRSLDSALNIPIFTMGSFDTGRLSELSSWVSHVVPPLTKPDAGRPNPFQL